MDIKRIILTLIASFMLCVNSYASENNTGSTTIPVNDIPESGIKRVRWHKLEILIVKRSTAQLEELRANEDLLADPNSNESNPLDGIAVSKDDFVHTYSRSLIYPYLVVINIGPASGCYILPFISSGEQYWNTGKKIGLGKDWKGGFYDSCKNLRYDLSGRVYKNNYSQVNLLVPEYWVNDKGEVVLGRKSLKNSNETGGLVNVTVSSKK